MWEQAVDDIRRIGSAQPPHFEDAYHGRWWDAAQFRIYGLTAFDKHADWLTSQCAQMRSHAGPLIKLLAVRWNVWLHDPCNLDGANGERRDRIMRAILHSSQHGEALLQELDALFLSELRARSAHYPLSAAERARHLAVTGALAPDSL